MPRRGVGGRTLVLFFALAFGLAWGLIALLLLFTAQVEAIFGPVGYANPLFVLAVWSPGIVGAFLVFGHYSFGGLVSFFRRVTLWRMPLAWWAFLVIGIPAVKYLGAAISGTITDPLPFSSWYGVLPVLALGLFVGPVEEFGWRGFALPRLETCHAPVLATAILSFVWVMWHLPLVLVDPRFSHGFASVAPQILLALLTMLTIFCYAFFYTWVYNRTQSVLLCVLLHGSFNAAIGLLPASLAALQRGTYVALLVVQVLTLLLAVDILAVATGGRLGHAAVTGRDHTDAPEERSGLYA
jgi:membrane protease YdiL (CAAX protease family)